MVWNDFWTTVLMGADAVWDNLPFYISAFGRVLSTFASIMSQIASLVYWLI